MKRKWQNYDLLCIFNCTACFPVKKAVLLPEEYRLAASASGFQMQCHATARHVSFPQQPNSVATVS